MQPNDPNQQPAGFPPNQPSQQPSVPSQSQGTPPQQFAQPQPSYPTRPQSNTFAQPQQPMTPQQPPLYGQPQQPQQTQYLNPLEPSPQQFQSVPEQMPPSGSSGKKILLISLAIVVVLALGIGGYLFATKSDTKAPATTSTTSKTSTTPKTTGDFKTLGSFTLVAPAASSLNGMTVAPATVADTYTVLTSSDGSCTIGFGILSQAALPGTDLNSLIAIKIADAKKQDTNIKATGPTAADSLVLKDTLGKTYALPTANFSLTDSTTGGGTVAETYSAYELADKSHAVIYTTCNSDKAGDQTAIAAKVKALQPVAQAIAIQVK